MLALSRSAAGLAALAVAAALHAAVGWGVAASLATPVAADTRLSTQPAMAVRKIVVAGANPVRPAAVLATPASRHATGTPSGMGLPLASPAVAQREPVFLASDDVDEPARPALAWAMDAEALMSLGITRIVFDTWVDATASLVSLRVVAIEPASMAGLTPLIEARLADTVMVAARKSGQPVAQQQRIDLGWERSPARPG